MFLYSSEAHEVLLRCRYQLEVEHWKAKVKENVKLFCFCEW